MCLTDFAQNELGGDEERYSLNAVYILAWGLQQCRTLLGKSATCGIRTPQHEYLAQVFVKTGMDGYLTGEIEFDQIKRNTESKHQTPLEVLLMDGNLTALTYAIGMWISGGNYVAILLFQIIVIVLGVALVVELGWWLSDWKGATMAGLCWAIYGLTQMRGHMLPQVYASTLFVLATLLLVRGMRQKQGIWLLMGYAAYGLVSFYAVGLRPYLMFLMPGLLMIYFLLSRSERELVQWPLYWLGFVGMLTLATFPLRVKTLDEGETLTFSRHLAHVFRGGQKADFNPASLFDREGWRTVEKPGAKPPQSGSDLLADLIRDPALSARVLPIKFYQIWSMPWRHYKPLGLPLPVIIHQAFVIIGFAGLFLFMGYKDWRGAFGWIFFIALALSTFTYAYLTVEPRYMIPFMGPLCAMGSALIAHILARLRSSVRNMIIALVIVAISVTITGYLNIATLSLVLTAMPSKAIFGMTVIVKLVWITSIFFLIVRLLKPEGWQFLFLLAPMMTCSVVFCYGQFASHWLQWDLPLTNGVVARQVITLPADSLQITSRNAWLLFDAAPNDHFQIKINGRIVKNPEQALMKWQADDEKYDRIWRALPLNHDDLQTNARLIVDVQSVGKSPTKLYGDFSPENPAIFYGPAVDYRGEYRSIWRSRWSPINEPRVSKAFDLYGVNYQSVRILSNGQVLTDDLSPDFGRQHGRFRIYLGFFNSDEAPSVATNNYGLFHLDKHFTSNGGRLQ